MDTDADEVDSEEFPEENSVIEFSHTPNPGSITGKRRKRRIDKILSIHPSKMEDKRLILSNEASL